MNSRITVTLLLVTSAVFVHQPSFADQCASGGPGGISSSSMRPVAVTRFYEGAEALNFSLPNDADYLPPTQVQAAHASRFYEQYQQSIIAPDATGNMIAFPVKGGFTSLYRTTGPAGIGEVQSATISVLERKYTSLCWEAPVTNDPADNVSFAISNAIFEAQSRSQSNQEYIDFASGDIDVDYDYFFDTEDSRFKYRYIVSSSNAIIRYVMTLEFSPQGAVISESEFQDSPGISKNSGAETCNTPGFGLTTDGQCRSLAGLTEPSQSGGFNAFNDTFGFGMGVEFLESGVVFIATDSDNLWIETQNRPVTELLTNMRDFNDYLLSLTGQNYSTITGNGILNSGLGLAAIGNTNDQRIISRGGAVFVVGGDNNLINKAVFAQPGLSLSFDNGSTFREVTWSRALDVVAHEFVHGIMERWFSGNISDPEECALNEGFADVIGSATAQFIKGSYAPQFAVDAFDNNDQPVGLRNFANPSLTGSDSVYNPQTPLNGPGCRSISGDGGGGDGGGGCVMVPGGVTCVRGANGRFHNHGVILAHLYHLMTHGGFNEDSSFRPDPFGVSDDEVFSFENAQRIIFDGMARLADTRPGSLSYCQLRENMLSITSGDQRAAVNQAWRHVFKNLDDSSLPQNIRCVLPDGLEIVTPEIEIRFNGTVISNGDTIVFPSTAPGSSNTLSLQFRNTGEYKLRTGAFSVEAPFAIDHTPAEAIPSNLIGESLILSFNPIDAGTYSQILSFSTNDADLPSFSLILTGESVQEAPIPANPSIVYQGASYPEGSTINFSVPTGGSTDVFVELQNNNTYPITFEADFSAATGVAIDMTAAAELSSSCTQTVAMNENVPVVIEPGGRICIAGQATDRNQFPFISGTAEVPVSLYPTGTQGPFSPPPETTLTLRFTASSP